MAKPRFRLGKGNPQITVKATPMLKLMVVAAITTKASSVRQSPKETNAGKSADVVNRSTSGLTEDGVPTSGRPLAI